MWWFRFEYTTAFKHFMTHAGMFLNKWQHTWRYHKGIRSLLRNIFLHLLKCWWFRVFDTRMDVGVGHPLMCLSESHYGVFKSALHLKVVIVVLYTSMIPKTTFLTPIWALYMTLQWCPTPVRHPMGIFFLIFFTLFLVSDPFASVNVTPLAVSDTLNIPLQ